MQTLKVLFERDYLIINKIPYVLIAANKNKKCIFIENKKTYCPAGFYTHTSIILIKYLLRVLLECHHIQY